MKVGYFQFAPVFGNITRNLATMSQRLSTVECDLMVLPELFNTGYQFVSVDEVRALAEEIPGGPTTERLRKLAAERRTHVVAGWAERGGKKRLTYIGNSEVVTPDGEILRRAKSDQETLAVVEIDPLEARNKKINPYNDLLAGRRPEFYSR